LRISKTTSLMNPRRQSNSLFLPPAFRQPAFHELGNLLPLVRRAEALCASPTWPDQSRTRLPGVKLRHRRRAAATGDGHDRVRHRTRPGPDLLSSSLARSARPGPRTPPTHEPTGNFDSNREHTFPQVATPRQPYSRRIARSRLLAATLSRAEDEPWGARAGISSKVSRKRCKRKSRGQVRAILVGKRGRLVGRERSHDSRGFSGTLSILKIKDL
jgi:hypothetical protein